MASGKVNWMSGTSQPVSAFNELLTEAGIDPKEVRLLRHQTRGLGGRTPFTLWRDDLPAFERYQSTQRADRRVLRDAPYWASFVSPAPGETMFVGLYHVRRVSSGPVEWPCPLRGGPVGEGRPYDVFETHLMDELAGQIGRLRVAWDPTNVRSWIRYAEGMNLSVLAPAARPVSSAKNRIREGAEPLGAEDLVRALVERGFEVGHATSKVRLLQRGRLNLYVKRSTGRLPLVVHPYFESSLAEVRRIPGVETDQPVTFYVNSNLREFPAYTAEHRASSSRFGIDLSVRSDALDPLLDLLTRNLDIDTPAGPVRRLGSADDPLTEREQLGLARIGQGSFRSALIGYWNGACAVTGLDQLELLRASHIKPWRHASDSERLDPFNGLLLAPNLDAVFDRGLITFGSRGEIILSTLLSEENRGRLGILEGFGIDLEARHQPYLDHHREQVFLP